MNEEITHEAAMLEGFMSAIGRDCPECGEVNPSDAEFCEFCGAEMEMEDEDPTLSIMQAVGVGDMGISGEEVDEALRKVPLANATNLILLRDTVEKIRMNQITMDEYKKNVSRVLNVARNGVELFKSDLVKKRIATFNENIQSLVWDTAALYEDFLEGCQRMMEYEGGIKTNPATEGLAMIETTLRNMDSLHDEVIDTSRHIEEEPDDQPDDGSTKL